MDDDQLYMDDAGNFQGPYSRKELGDLVQTGTIRSKTRIKGNDGEEANAKDFFGQYHWDVLTKDLPPEIDPVPAIKTDNFDRPILNTIQGNEDCYFCKKRTCEASKSVKVPIYKSSFIKTTYYIPLIMGPQDGWEEKHSDYRVVRVPRCELCCQKHNFWYYWKILLSVFIFFGTLIFYLGLLAIFVLPESQAKSVVEFGWYSGFFALGCFLLLRISLAIMEYFKAGPLKAAEHDNVKANLKYSRRVDYLLIE